MKEMLDLNKRSDKIISFEESLKASVIGQDEAVDAVVKIYQSYLAGMKMPNRPVGNLLFLGPTGVGKTLLVEAVAETLYGNRNSFLKINCSEYQASHEIAKLTGAPSGYVGYGDGAVFQQANIDKYATEKCKLSIVLFDEVEKANDSFWKLLLSILDKANLTLGNGATADFSNSLIFMTSNLGSKDISDLTKDFGFISKDDSNVTKDRIKSIAEKAAHKHFSPEFVNRLDSIVVFNTLTEKQIRQILVVETGLVQGRILLSNTPFVVEYTDEARDALLADGYDIKYGARHIRRSIERNIVFPLTVFMASEQIGFGDVVKVDYKKHKFIFERELAGAVTAVVKAKECARNALEAKEAEKNAPLKKRDKSTSILGI